MSALDYVRVAPHFGQVVAVESIKVPQYAHGTLTVSRITTCWTGGWSRGMRFTGAGGA